jgi:putative N6-adenine-specific DNA methylase
VSRRVDTFSICQPGLEPILAAEVQALGVSGRPTHGGVIGSMTWAQLALANLHLRTATRVLVRAARFDATTFGELGAGLRRIDWSGWLPPAAHVLVRVASSRSALYHTGAIEDRVREVVPDGDGDPQQVHVRIDRDLVTVSLDSSGDPLYMRGWRHEAGQAPMRETLAAALVLWSGWNGKTSLADPCCGAGTVAIEAALFVRRIAPGRRRSFTMQRWPVAASVDWSKLRAAADADVRPRSPVIVASDADPDAVAMTVANARAAGVELVTEVRDVTTDQPAFPAVGYVVTNPPYGGRLDGDLRRIYAGIGRAAGSDGHLTTVAPEGAPTSAFGVPWWATLSTRNGGIPVRFLRH